MANVRKTISISDTLDSKAEELRLLLDHPDFSSLMQDLIRREYERRQGPSVIAREPAAPYRVNSAADPAARHRAEVESLEHDMIADNLRKLDPPPPRPPRKPKGAK